MRPSLLHLADMHLPEPAPLTVRESVLDASEELDKLTDLALKNLRQILEPKVDLEDHKLMKAKLAASGQVLTTQVRVDEGRLKRKQQDSLSKLLALVAQEEGRPFAMKMIEGTLVASGD